MSVFKDMQETHVIDSQWQLNELKRMLREAIARGFVEQISPMQTRGMLSLGEEWYRDKETGEVYRLQPPDEKGGLWGPIDQADFRNLTDKIQ